MGKGSGDYAVEGPVTHVRVNSAGHEAPPLCPLRVSVCLELRRRL